MPQPTGRRSAAPIEGKRELAMQVAGIDCHHWWSMQIVVHESELRHLRAAAEEWVQHSIGPFLAMVLCSLVLFLALG